MRIDDPRAAAIFANSALRRIVLCLVDRPRSLSELAKESGLDLKRLHHHVGKFCRLGLVRVVEEKPRAGRPIKMYHAAAAEFFVPHGMAPEMLTEGLARELRKRLADEADTNGSGFLFSLGPAGEPLARPMHEPGLSSSGFEFWRLPRLTSAEAQALQEDMRAVLDRYSGSSSRRGHAYLVHAALIRRHAPGSSAGRRRRG